MARPPNAADRPGAAPLKSRSVTPWSNKRLVRILGLAAALLGSGYGLWLAATWSPSGVG